MCFFVVLYVYKIHSMVPQDNPACLQHFLHNLHLSTNLEEVDDPLTEVDDPLTTPLALVATNGLITFEKKQLSPPSRPIGQRSMVQE